MLSYLTDVTVFWAVSLLCYALLFRKTTFHGWNRAVLLGTLLLGLLLPLWPAPLPETVAQMPLYHRLPVARISEVKTETLQRVTADVKPAFSFSLWTVYWVGCAIAAFIYLRAFAKLLRLMRRGRKCASGLAYETGVIHAPFSFWRRTFLSHCTDYNTADLALILRHEARHGKLFHTADVLLLLVLRIALWFHPLVYVYDFLLRQVHEYQADAFARNAPQEYGHLLLREATGNTLSIAHSFNHSPLKSRILMLTKNTSLPVQKLRYLLLVPVVIMAAFSCQKKEPSLFSETISFPGDTVFFFRGNEFVREEGSKVAKLAKWGNGKMESFGRIIKMNGEPVYFTKDVDFPATYSGPEKSAFHELCKRIMPALQALPDGNYSIIMGISSEVISKEGTLELYSDDIYIGTDVETIHNFKDIWKKEPQKKEPPKLPEHLRRPVIRGTHMALDEGFSFSPAMKDGKPVNSIPASSVFNPSPNLHHIIVKSGTVTIQ